MDEIVGVSFVCLGNICRSPLAQGVFQDLVNREDLDQKNPCVLGRDQWLARW